MDLSAYEAIDFQCSFHSVLIKIYTCQPTEPSSVASLALRNQEGADGHDNNHDDR